MSTEHLLEKLKSKNCVPNSCPACHQITQWEVAQQVFQLLEFSKGNLVVGGPVIPVLPVACLKCGYTYLFNTIILQK